MRLAALQADFAAAVLDVASAVPNGIERTAGEERCAARFSIYRNNAYLALVSVLEARFGTVARLTGEAFFKAMARDYAGETPSAGALMDYGASFPGFIACFDPAGDVPYLADVAAIDLAVHRAFFAADAAPLTATRFASAFPGPETVLAFHPAASIVSSVHPAGSIWLANQTDRTGSLQDAAGAEGVLITRPGLQVQVRTAPPGAGCFFARLATGEPIGAAYEGALGAAETFDLGAALELLLTAGALAGVLAGIAPSKQENPVP